jgi:hypothetical protein
MAQSTLVGYENVEMVWVESANGEAVAGVDIDGGQSAAAASALYASDGVLASPLRSTYGLKLNNVSISSGGGVASTSIIASSAPAGLRPNQKIWLTTGATNLTSGNTEVVQVAPTYVVGSATIPITTAIALSGHTTILWSASAYAGPQAGLILPSAILPVQGVVFDPATGFYAQAVAATQDAQAIKNVPEHAIGLLNGAATIDRLQGIVGRAYVFAGGAQATSIAAAGASLAGSGILKATPGVICKAQVTAAGNGSVAMLIYDTASGTATGNVIGVVKAAAAVGDQYTFDMPAALGISVPAQANAPTITLSWA